MPTVANKETLAYHGESASAGVLASGVTIYHSLFPQSHVTKRKGKNSLWQIYLFQTRLFHFLCASERYCWHYLVHLMSVMWRQGSWKQPWRHALFVRCVSCVAAVVQVTPASRATCFGFFSFPSATTKK